METPSEELRKTSLFPSMECVFSHDIPGEGVEGLFPTYDSLPIAVFIFERRGGGRFVFRDGSLSFPPEISP